MHSQQKAAWYSLIVSVGTIALYSAAVPLLSWRLDRPWMSVAVPAMGIFGLFGLTWVTRSFSKPRHDGKPSMDERDHLLSTRAWRAGMVAFGLVFVFACVGFWAFMRYVRGLDQVTVPVEFFPGLAVVGAIIVTIVQSLATLHYYGWRWNDAAGR